MEKASDLCTPHPDYLALGADAKKRCEKYRALFKYDLNEADIQLIRKAANKGLVTGNDRFRNEIEALTGRRVKEKKRGRPVGWRKPDV